jgi:hypothetical protein
VKEVGQFVVKASGIEIGAGMLDFPYPRGGIPDMVQLAVGCVEGVRRLWSLWDLVKPFDLKLFSDLNDVAAHCEEISSEPRLGIKLFLGALIGQRRLAFHYLRGVFNRKQTTSFLVNFMEIDNFASITSYQHPCQLSENLDSA